jgi:hypothetical protein
VPVVRGYIADVKYLMLMWADADAASGDEADWQAWAEFDEQVKAAGAFVANGALQPAATDARLVRTKIDGHPLPSAVEQRPFAPGTRQIQAFYLMECDNMDAAVGWANQLPTYGLVEVRELIDY